MPVNGEMTASAWSDVETVSPYELQLDGNLYHREGGGAYLARSRGGNNVNWTFANWKRVTGQDQKSIEADPKFMGGTPYDLRLSGPQYLGQSAHFQWAVRDSLAAGGLAFSNAATLTLWN